MGICGGNVQFPLIGLGVFFGHLLDTFDFTKDVVGNFDNLLAGRSRMGQVFATTTEDLDPQFILQHTYLLTDPWLGGIKVFGGRGNIEVMIDHFCNISELLQFHL